MSGLNTSKALLDQLTVRAAFERAKKLFDRAASLQHIEMVAGDRNCLMDFRTVPESPALIKRLFGELKSQAAKAKYRFNFRGTFTALEELLRRRNAQGYAIYFSVNETDGRGARKENIKSVRVLVLDLDGSPLPDADDWRITPHLIEETSSGRYQVTWCIEPTDDIEAAEDMARRLAVEYDGDPKVHDASHVFRLAGFVHQKRKLFTSRLITVNEFERPVKLAEFDAFLPRLPKRRKSSGRGVGQLSVGAARLLFQHFPVEKIGNNDRWQPFAMALHSACDGSDEIAEMFFDFCQTDPNFSTAYDRAKAVNRWQSFKSDKDGGVTIGTLEKMCREAQVPGAIMFAVFNDATRDFENV